MNRTYALVWNPSLAAWTVTDERARRRGKGAGAVLAAALLLPLTAIAADLPSGGQVVAGSGAISTPSAQQMVIDQASNKLAIDWQSFDIAAGNKVTFHQPGRDSVALNRVLGSDGSKIMGQLDANGRVFIINPNGVLFGAGASVNVGGLVASTLDISNSDFEAGNYRFKGDGSNASVTNKGHITAADGGSVALLGGTVSNNGVIVANQGSVALAAGNAVTLDFAGDGLLNVQVDEAVVDALVENHQLIKADGGQVLLTANAGDALLKTVVNNTGVIEARTLGEREGKIVLLGNFDGGTVQVAGTLDASAPKGGDGGFIETSGAHVKVADSAKVTTKAASGKTGKWLIDPNDFTIAASGGDMTGAAVSTAVQNNNFEIQTATMGTAGGNGDIHVNDAITWNSGNTLTLNAERNININAAITAQHASGKVALKYGQATADGGTADYHIKAPINLQSGQNFSTQKGSSGTETTYTVVNDATALQDMNSNLNGNYAVSSNIDLSSISNWVPVGNGSSSFSGQFAGLGHTLSNLTIDRSGTNFVGLFGSTVSGSVIRDIGLVGGSVKGGSGVGGLVGRNNGAISNAYATGSVSGTGVLVGGLVGSNNSGATTSNAYATGSVSGEKFVGGLAGDNNGTISNAYATGSVSGTDYVGGLVGNSNGTISSSFYATTDADGNAVNNGGETSGVYSGNAYGTGKTWAELTQASTFTGWDIASTGGSNAIWRIYDGYSGPLLRSFLQSITLTADASGGSKTYDSTAATGNTTYTGSDLDTSKLQGTLGYTSNSKNAGTYSSADGSLIISGLYSGQQGYDISYADTSLTISKANLAVSGISASDRTYDATTSATLAGTASVTAISGDTVSVSGTGVGTFADKNAGANKAVTVTGYSLTGNDAGNYNILQPTGLTASISKANLAVSGISATDKTYDATTAATLAGTASVSAITGDTVSVSGTGVGTFADKNAGANKAVTASGYTLSGSDAGNYNIVQPTGLTADINKAALTITANNASKTYNGLAFSGGNGVSYNGFVNGEDANVLGGTLTYGGSSQGAINAGSYGLNVSGLTASNYAISYNAGSLNVAKAQATVTANSGQVTYNGQQQNIAGFTASGLVNGETTSVLSGVSTSGGSGTNAGSYTHSASGTDGNYLLTFVDGNLTIDKAQATVTANSGQVTYNGQQQNIAGFTASGLVNGETASVLNGVSTTGGSGTNAGSYSHSASGTDGNYELTFVDGGLTIDKAALTITALDASKTAGQSIALSGYSANGLMGGDSISAVSLNSLGQPTTAAAGSYAIVASSAVGESLSNYDISYQDGTLLVSPAAITPTTPSNQQPTASTAPYIGVLASNGQSVATQAPQQARPETVSEPEAQNPQMLVTNPLADIMNLQVINQGIRLPEGI